MQGVTLITFILVGAVFSLPYPKTPVEVGYIYPFNFTLLLLLTYFFGQK